MKFPYSMLLDFVQTDLNAQQIGDLLTMAGFELEGIEQVDGDDVLDIKVVSNRGDGLSVFGLAREVLAKVPEAEPTALYEAAAGRFDLTDETTTSDVISIQTEDCRRFAARKFENVTNGEAPEWIRKRLEQAGMRSISLLVDLTNYVMLELGQPLHAYDLDKLQGEKLIVRKARAGEKLTTLDGKEHELRPDQMMICDAEAPVGAAGIMGGEATEVSATTSRILLESANFLNTSVRRTRKQMGLNTEASYRFERSVDPDGVTAAIARFTQLLGLEGGPILDLYPGKVELKPIELRIDRARKLLGMEISEREAAHYVRRLGMDVSGHGNPFWVVPPSWRPDLVREDDLIEELGRVHGYDRIPESFPQGVTTQGGPQGFYREVDQVRMAAVAAGYVQAISHSLRDVHPLDELGERVQPRVASSPEMAYLRNSILPSLADAAQRNGGKNIHLFEIGQVFRRNSATTTELKELAVLSTGDLIPTDLKNEKVPQADFYSLRGDLEAIAAASGFAFQTTVPSAPDARFHPTRQASMAAGKVEIGRFGQIHPEIAKALRLPELTMIGIVDLAKAFEFGGVTELRLKAISRNPAVGRDISLLIDKSVPYADVHAAIAQAGGDILERQWLFDVFAGGSIPEGKHSLGIGLSFRKVGENFTDEEANQVREQIVAALVALGGTTR